MKKGFYLPIYFALILILFSANSSAANFDWLWAKNQGGIYSERAQCVATDGAGNVYVTGYFTSPTITFGSSTFTNSSSGNADVFLTKYDASGNVLWARCSGGTLYDQAMSVTVDDFGNVFIAGYFNSDSLIFGGDTLINSGFDDVFFVKYDSSGNVIWARSGNGTSYDHAFSIATDAIGDLFVCGYFGSLSISFGSTTLTNSYSLYGDIFLVKYNTTGNVIWAKSAGGTNHDQANSVACDAIGNVYIGGYFDSHSIVFGSTTLTNVNSSEGDFFLAKYDSNGNSVWAKSSGGNRQDNIESIDVDLWGNIYVTGDFVSAAIIFGSDTLTNPFSGIGTTDILLCKYDSAGNSLWGRCAGEANWDVANSVTTNALGDIYITGWFGADSITFGNSTIVNAGSWDILLAKYDSYGNALWATSSGGSDYDYAYSVTTDLNGDIYVAGYFSSASLTFGIHTLTNTANTFEDIFIAKLSSLTGIDNVQMQNGISIYPNPSNGKFTIENKSNAIDIVDIYNGTGEKMCSREISTAKFELDFSYLPDGIYFVRIVSVDENFSKKIVIAK